MEHLVMVNKWPNNDKPCVKCGGTERYKPPKGKNLGACKACTKASAAQWQSENAEKKKASDAKYRADNRERLSAYHAKRYAENAEKILACHAKRYADNPEKIKARSAKYYADNAEKVKTRQAKYRADNPENPEKVNARSAKRRALKAGAEGAHTAADRKAIIALNGGLCIVPGCDELATHIDHIVPLSTGGSNWPSNLQPMCAYHNISKGNRNTINYRPGTGAEYWRQQELFGEPA